MRRRLSLVVLAVTTMVAAAFLVPLAAVVQVVARDRALSAGEQEARSLSGVLAAIGGVDAAAELVAQVNADRDHEALLVLPDGRRVGADVALTAPELELARGGRAFTTSATAVAGGGRRIVVPVRTGEGVTVVVVHVRGSAMHRGVVQSWIVLAAVGAALIAIALALANRLSGATVRAIESLGEVTARLEAGDLEARVQPSGPAEVEAAGRTLNALADRIDDLLAGEREALADLSHRVRTPLTAMQLEVDTLHDEAERSRLDAAVGRVAEALNRFIAEARRPPSRSSGPLDVAAVVRDRAAFWSVLADDQGRRFDVDVDDRPCLVRDARPDDVGAAVDALLANVFQHTPEGTAFLVRVGAVEGEVVVAVEDGGPGLTRPVVRGRSGAGSTGLGLDIARSTAERAGGTLVAGSASGGGAAIRLSFPAA